MAVHYYNLKDKVAVRVKIGDGPSYKHGQIVEIIDPMPWLLNAAITQGNKNIREDNFPLGDMECKDFAFILRPREEKEKLQALANENAVYMNGDAVEDVAPSTLRRCLDITAVKAACGIATIDADWSDKSKVVAPVDISTAAAKDLPTALIDTKQLEVKR